MDYIGRGIYYNDDDAFLRRSNLRLRQDLIYDDFPSIVYRNRFPDNDDVTIRALPINVGGGLEMLTSRRYPYSHTMADLEEDLRRSRPLCLCPCPLPQTADHPRVVSTSYEFMAEEFAPPPPPFYRRSVEDLVTPQFYLRPVTPREKFPRETSYEIYPELYAKKRNADFPFKPLVTSYTPYAPYKHVHVPNKVKLNPVWDSYKPYEYKFRQFRYVHEGVPFHTKNELEMERIDKEKAIAKWFPKKEKSKKEAKKPKKETEAGEEVKKETEEEVKEKKPLNENEPEVKGNDNPEQLTNQNESSSAINGEVDLEMEEPNRDVLSAPENVQEEIMSPSAPTEQPLREEEKTNGEVVQIEKLPPEEEENEEELQPENNEEERILIEEQEPVREEGEKNEVEEIGIQEQNPVKIAPDEPPKAPEEPLEEITDVEEVPIEIIATSAKEEVASPNPSSLSEPVTELTVTPKTAANLQTEDINTPFGSGSSDTDQTPSEPQIVEDTDQTPSEPQIVDLADEKPVEAKEEIDDKPNSNGNINNNVPLNGEDVNVMNKETEEATTTLVTILQPTGQVLVEEKDLGSDESIRIEHEILEIEIIEHSS